MRWLAFTIAATLVSAPGGEAGATDIKPKSAPKQAPAKKTGDKQEPPKSVPKPPPAKPKDGNAPAKAPSQKGTLPRCTGTGANRKCLKVSGFSGHNAPEAALRKDPLPRPSGDVWLKAVNLNAEVRVNI